MKEDTAENTVFQQEVHAMFLGNQVLRLHSVVEVGTGFIPPSNGCQYLRQTVISLARSQCVEKPDDVASDHLIPLVIIHKAAISDRRGDEGQMNAPARKSARLLRVSLMTESKY